MYEAFFEMKRTPFASDIEADALYMSPMLDETLSRLKYAADKRLFAVVTADVGCGKTTSIRRFTEDLPKERFEVLYLSDSKLTPRWFYRSLLDQLGIESKFYRGDARRQLHQQLEIIQGVYKKHVVTIVDEAHLLAKETLEEIRFLLNTKMDSNQPMTLILVGQNELWDKLKLKSYAAIRQRIDIKCEIPQLDRSQAEAYIHAHLEYAQGQVDIFTDKALDEIYRFSAGSARAINKLCTHALLYACQRAKKLVDDHMIRTVIQAELPGGSL
jgi:type II secretory pathway predicted ATPase ExeA